MKKYNLAAKRNFIFHLSLIFLPLILGGIISGIINNYLPSTIGSIITIIAIFGAAHTVYIPKVIKTKYGCLYYIIREKNTGTYIELKKNNTVGWKHLTTVHINTEDSAEKIVKDVEKGYEIYLKTKQKRELDKKKAKSIENKLSNLSNVRNDMLIEELKKLKHE